MRTNHRSRQETRLERIRHKRMQHFVFDYVQEKNRYEIIAKFRFHPKTGKEYYVATGILNPENKDLTIELYKLKKKLIRHIQTIIWAGQQLTEEQVVNELKSYLPQNPSATENSTGDKN